MKTFELGFGKGTQTISLPSQQVINQVEGNEAPAIEDIPAAVIEALRNPNGTPPLQTIVSPGETVCIVVSDLTRAWIRHELILPPLLNELNEAGIPDENIKLIVALGTHRPHTPAEDLAVYGEEVMKRVKVIQHECQNEDELIYVGPTD